MKNIEKGREVEQRLKDHIDKYPLTTEEAFEKVDKDSKLDESISTTAGNVTDVTVKGLSEIKYDLDEFVEEEDLGKFKQIDINTSAYEIPMIGCIVRSWGGTVFVPNASLTEDEDGMFNLIRGRVIK